MNVRTLTGMSEIGITGEAHFREVKRVAP